MIGGAICGYCATGNVGKATAPMRTMMIASTDATIGRRMKNWLNMRHLQSWDYHIAALMRIGGRSFGGPGRGLIGLDFRQRRLHRGARASALEAVDDDSIRCRKPFKHHAH